MNYPEGNKLSLGQSIERRLYKALTHPLSPHEEIENLVRNFEYENLNLRDFELLCSSLIKVWRGDLVFRICLRKIEDNKEIPWGHLVEAVYQVFGVLEENIRTALVEGAKLAINYEDIGKSHLLDDFEPEIPRKRTDRRSTLSDKHYFLKQELLSQAEILKTQELDVEEEVVLRKLQRLFPRDVAIARLHEELKQRKAMRLLESKIQSPRFAENIERIELSTEEAQTAKPIFSSMNQMVKKQPELANDFAIFWHMAEGPDLALKFTQKKPARVSECWLKIEILFALRRFAEVIDSLQNYESILIASPEGIFGIMYLKALCYWEMGDKFSALEVLSALIARRPQHRNALSLFHAWKSAGGT